jgi:hypothetical protein
MPSRFVNTDDENVTFWPLAVLPNKAAALPPFCPAMVPAEVGFTEEVTVSRLTKLLPEPVVKTIETWPNDSVVIPLTVVAGPLVIARNWRVALIGVPAAPNEVGLRNSKVTGTATVAKLPKGLPPPTLVNLNAWFAVLWKNCANVPPPARAGPEMAQLSSVAAAAAIKSGTRNIFIDVVSFTISASLSPITTPRERGIGTAVAEATVDRRSPERLDDLAIDLPEPIRPGLPSPLRICSERRSAPDAPNAAGSVTLAPAGSRLSFT